MDPLPLTPAKAGARLPGRAWMPGWAWDAGIRRQELFRFPHRAISATKSRVRLCCGQPKIASGDPSSTMRP